MKLILMNTKLEFKNLSYHHITGVTFPYEPKGIYAVRNQWVAEGRVANDTSGTLSASDYVDITGCVKIKVPVVSHNEMGVAFYTNNTTSEADVPTDAVVSGKCVHADESTTPYTYSIMEINVPEGAKYVRFTIPTSSASEITYIEGA